VLALSLAFRPRPDQRDEGRPRCRFPHGRRRWRWRQRRRRRQRRLEKRPDPSHKSLSDKSPVPSLARTYPCRKRSSGGKPSMRGSALFPCFLVSRPCPRVLETLSTAGRPFCTRCNFLRVRKRFCTRAKQFFCTCARGFALIFLHVRKGFCTRAKKPASAKQDLAPGAIFCTCARGFALVQKNQRPPSKIFFFFFDVRSLVFFGLLNSRSPARPPTTTVVGPQGSAPTAAA
jgi:hypothetical protein